MAQVTDRSRSRSPGRHSHHRSHRDRDEPSSSRRHHHRRHHHGHSASKPERELSPAMPPRPIVLPFKAKDLSKSDLAEYRLIFASYLDIQKQIYIEDLTEEEVKGRWKSFIKKWNLKELAEGWYDPETKQKAIESAERSAQEIVEEPRAVRNRAPQEDSAASDDDYGPVLPPGGASRRAGAPVPNFSDLALRREQIQEEHEHAREDLRYERKQDRLQQKERLDELVPRAEGGTRERQLEKKRDTAVANREFAAARGGGDGIAEVAESELMGAGGGVDDVRRMRKEEERKKNEREIRREEILRARAAEREERMELVRAKESKTMEMLQAIAKERFG